MGGTFDYSVFGLHVRSHFELPELLAVPSMSEPDVTIRLGTIAIPPGSPRGLVPTKEGLLLNIEGVAKYSITKGSRIIVDPEPGVPIVNVRLYLLGSVMGIVLHQRGLLPLHANCVEIGGRAFAFMGKSGAGKSTLAAWFHDRGHRVITDDVCVVRFDEEDRPYVNPGLPRLRLWREALEATGREPSLYQRSYAGDDTYEKFDVPISQQSGDAEIQLAGIYVLGTGDKLTIAHLQGVEAAEAVFANTYRGAYLSSVGNSRLHWEACLKLIGRTPIHLLVRKWSLSRLSSEGERIIAHAEKEHPRGLQG